LARALHNGRINSRTWGASIIARSGLAGGRFNLAVAIVIILRVTGRRRAVEIMLKEIATVIDIAGDAMNAERLKDAAKGV
jgi:hypothetical protein